MRASESPEAAPPDLNAMAGAAVWLRDLLRLLGFGQHLVLPVLIFGILLGWHHVKGYPWRFRPGTLLGMLVESLCFAVILMVLARLQSRLPFLGSPTASLDSQLLPLLNLRKVIGLCAYFGAGIYEELLFRLILLQLIILIAGRTGLSKKACWWWGVLLSSLVFSAAHYKAFTGYGDELQLFSFTFRFLAGIFFSVLFLKRGFGIAVGAHAVFDLLAVLL